MDLTKEEFYREKLQDEQLEDHKLEHDFIKKEYDIYNDRHAKKNRDSQAQELREQGYHVECSRTTNLRGGSIYQLWADKNIENAGTVQ